MCTCRSLTIRPWTNWCTLVHVCKLTKLDAYVQYYNTNSVPQIMALSYCALCSLCTYRLCILVWHSSLHSLQKENCSFIKDLCHMSFTSVFLSTLPSHALHNHNLFLLCGTAQNSCDDKYNFTGPCHLCDKGLCENDNVIFAVLTY